MNEGVSQNYVGTVYCKRVIVSIHVELFLVNRVTVTARDWAKNNEIKICFLVFVEMWNLYLVLFSFSFRL